MKFPSLFLDGSPHDSRSDFGSAHPPVARCLNTAIPSDDKRVGKILVGLDAGTSVIKAVAFDLACHSIAEASVHNETIVRTQGAAEQNIVAVWAGACACLRELAEKIPDLRERTIAVGVSAQGDGLWRLDRNNAPVGDALIWWDGRSAGIVQTLSRSGADGAIFRP